VIDKITEKKPAAKPTQKKDEMKAEDDMDLERAKIINSLKREIKDLQNEKMKLEEYTNYGFTPPAMWEHDLHEQKSIESFSSQRLSRMNKFYQKELDRISDINAQIEDLYSYLFWIDEFYGTRVE